jgi:hypothetical protein
MKAAIWTFQRSNALKNCKETEILLYEMLIYKIVSRIIMFSPLHLSLSCTFPKGNRIITSFLLNDSHKFLHVQRFELDPEAPKKALLTTTSKALRTITSKNEA